MSSLPKALEHLATYRSRNSRESQRIVDLGLPLLREGKIWTRNDDDLWLEQLALAAIDVGQLDVADECIAALSTKFTDSPRLQCLVGIRKEASEPVESVLKYYDGLLEEDESNAVAWKRKISVLRRSGNISKATEELSSFLDTHYSDVEGWLELADIYTTSHQYEYALQALQHVLLLAPQNPFYVLQSAETAYTLGDIPLASKMFLSTIDMTDCDPSESPIDSDPQGITVRAWFGLNQCTRKLLRDSRVSSRSVTQTQPPEHIQSLDELATEQILKAYSSSNGKISGREEVVKWLECN